MEVLHQESHPQDLLVYLYKLYQGQLLCDINIESKDGVVFYTHRLVLSATSTFIHQILLSNPALMSLKLDIGSEALQVLLEYGYTGQLFVSEHLHYDVRDAATYLQMYTVLDLLKRFPQIDYSLYQPAENNQNQQMTDGPVTDGYDYLYSDMCGSNEGGGLNSAMKRETDIVKVNPDISIEGMNDCNMMNVEGDDHVTQFDVSAEDKFPSPTRRCIQPADKQQKITQSSQESLKHEFDIEVKGHRSKRRSRLLKTERMESPVVVIERLSEDKFTRIKKKTSKNCAIENSKSSNDRKNGKRKRDDIVNMDKRNSSKQKHDKKSNGKRKGRKTKKHEIMKINGTKKNLSLKCLFCTSRLPIGAGRLKHLVKKHKETYLNQLFSRFLLRRYKTVKCRSGTSHSYSSETGSKKIISCSKKFSRYSQLHIKTDHSVNRKLSWFRFLILKSKNMCKESKVSKKKTTKTKAKKKKDKVVKKSKDLKKVSNKKCTSPPTKVKIELEGKLYSRQEIPGPESAAAGVFMCCICNKNLQSEFTLQKHLETVHSLSLPEARRHVYLLNTDIKCEVTTCQYSTTNILELQQHSVTMHPYISHKCIHCNAVFKVPIMLQRHILKKHTNPNGQTRIKTKPGQKRIEEKKYMCEVCGKCFPRTASLKRHEFFKHGVQKPGVKVYKCEHEDCNYQTASSSSLRVHANKHITEKPYTCEYCGMKLKTELSHKKHVGKMHLGVRPFLCQVCGLSFGEEHELKSHISNRHSDVREYKCRYCDYKSNVKYTFFTHVFRIHNIREEDDKRKEYKCTECNYKTILHHKFKIHMNGHTNTRNYWCTICNKAFISPGTLLTHMQWVHSDNYFSCTQCEYRTKTKQKLNEHIRVQHQLRGQKPYKCPYCDFRCATGGNTRKHIIQVHRGYEVRYERDDGLLEAARVARANGQHAALSIDKSKLEPPNSVVAGV